MYAIFNSFFTFLLLYKYAALFIITWIAAFAIPIPASSTLVAAGAFAAQGYLNPFMVFLIAFAGNVAGDLTGFLLVKHYGTRVFTSIGLRRVLSSRYYVEIARYILHFSRSLIYFSRFLTSVGPMVNVLSGLAGVPWRVFVLFDLLGETSYVVLYGGMGYFLGSQWENNFTFVIKAGLAMVLLGVISVLFHGLTLKNRRQLPTVSSHKED